MKVLGIGHAIPTAHITNDDILRELTVRAPHCARTPTTARIEAATLRFLETSGTVDRYVLAPAGPSI